MSQSVLLNVQKWYHHYIMIIYFWNRKHRVPIHSDISQLFFGNISLLTKYLCYQLTGYYCNMMAYFRLWCQVPKAYDVSVREQYWFYYDREPYVIAIKMVKLPDSTVCNNSMLHYSDGIMGVMASQINSLTIVYSTVYSGVHQRKHQSSASLAFVRGIHRWPVNSPHKWPVTRKMYLWKYGLFSNHEHDKPRVVLYKL